MTSLEKVIENYGMKERKERGECRSEEGMKEGRGEAERLGRKEGRTEGTKERRWEAKK